MARTYELTGPKSQDVYRIEQEFPDALNCVVASSDNAPEDRVAELKKVVVPKHLQEKISTTLPIVW